MIFKPHDYQSYCIDYIRTHPIAALLLDMGLGKTVITLTAIRDLMLDTCEVSKTLVIAPLRVARDTWPAEVEKWDHLKDLDVSVIVGTKKERLAAINHPALVYVVNRENVKFLVEHYEKNGLRWDFDLVVIDELSSFKNYQSQRFKWLRKVRPFVKRWVGLSFHYRAEVRFCKGKCKENLCKIRGRSSPPLRILLFFGIIRGRNAACPTESSV